MKSYPMTETMLGMFLEWNNARQSTQYTIAVVYTFPKTIDAEGFAKAVDDAVAANEIFRMRIVLEDETPRWVIDDGISIRTTRVSMSDAEADAWQKNFAKPFDAFKGPFARFSLVETPTTYRLFVEIFHLITDGTSVHSLCRLISANYARRGQESAAPTGETSPRFTDYLEAERKSFDSPEYAEAREAAIARFAGRAMSVPESTAEKGPLAGSPSYLDTDVTTPRAPIDAFCRKHEIHPNLFFMGVFARTLALYTNEKDVVFWTVNHGRGKSPQWKDTLGCFVKTIPVLGEMKRDLGCADYLRSFRLHKAGVYPFTHFCRDLGILPGWGVVYQEGTTDFALTLDDVSSRHLTPMTGGSGEIPVVQAYGERDTFRFEISCTPGKYDLDFIRRFVERMKIIAENIAAAAPEAKLGDIPVLSRDEQDAVLKMSYGGEMEYDGTKTFVDLFREQAATRPDAVAVVDCETSLTYRELDARSDALVRGLIAKGVVPGDFVAVKLPRRVSFATAIVAIQKCGAGYVPLDPEYPQDRLDYMVSDSGS